MSNETFKALVLEGGMTARAINPHPLFTGEIIQDSPVLNDEWDRFDHANPPIPLTAPHPAGSVIDVRKVWQVNSSHGWKIVDDELADFMQGEDFLVRIALEPIANITIKEEKPIGEWIEITDDNLPSQSLICEWKHPEYGIIKGNLVVYEAKRDNGYNESKWIYPEPDPVSQADIALCEFTHYRKFPKTPVKVIEKQSENTGERVEEAADIYANGFEDGTGSFIGYRAFIKGAQWQQSNSQQQVVELLEKEISDINQLWADDRLSNMFPAYQYTVFILSGILTQLKK